MSSTGPIDNTLEPSQVKLALRAITDDKQPSRPPRLRSSSVGSSHALRPSQVKKTVRFLDDTAVHNTACGNTTGQHPLCPPATPRNPRTVRIELSNRKDSMASFNALSNALEQNAGREVANHSMTQKSEPATPPVNHDDLARTIFDFLEQEQEHKREHKREQRQRCSQSWMILVWSCTMAFILGFLYLPLHSCAPVPASPRLAEPPPLNSGLKTLHGLSKEGHFDQYWASIEAFPVGEWQVYYLLCSLPRPPDVHNASWYREGFIPMIQGARNTPPLFDCSASRAEWSQKLYLQVLQGPLFELAQIVAHARVATYNHSIHVDSQFQILFASLAAFDKNLYQAQAQQAKLWPCIHCAISRFEIPSTSLKTPWTLVSRIAWSIDKSILRLFLREPLYPELIATSAQTISTQLSSIADTLASHQELHELGARCYAQHDAVMAMAQQIGIGTDFEFTEALTAIRMLCDWISGIASTNRSWAVPLLKGLSMQHLVESLRKGLQSAGDSREEARVAWVGPEAISGTWDIVREFREGVGDGGRLSLMEREHD